MLAKPPWSDDLATLDALVAHGLKRRTVRNRITRGLWLEPLPAVVCRTHGELSASQILTSATPYAGGGAPPSCGTAAAVWGFGHPGWAGHVGVGPGRRPR